MEGIEYPFLQLGKSLGGIEYPLLQLTKFEPISRFAIPLTKDGERM